MRSWSISHCRAPADQHWVRYQCPAVSGVLGSFPLSFLVTECQILLLLLALLPVLVPLSYKLMSLVASLLLMASASAAHS